MDAHQRRDRLRAAKELSDNPLLETALQEMEGRSVNELLVCPVEARDRWIGTILAIRQFKRQLEAILLDGVHNREIDDE